MAYVKSRCKGIALLYIELRMEEDSVNQYRNIDEIFNHLEGVFYNPDRKRLARDEYTQLKMNIKDDFTTFLAEFTRLAEEAA